MPRRADTDSGKQDIEPGPPAGRSIPILTNLTPHPVTLRLPGGDVETLPSSGVVRLVETVEPAGAVDGVPVHLVGYGEATGLPAPARDTVYVVSQMVAAAFPDRGDLYYPHDLVRDNEGRIIECRALARPAR